MSITLAQVSDLTTWSLPSPNIELAPGAGIGGLDAIKCNLTNPGVIGFYEAFSPQIAPSLSYNFIYSMRAYVDTTNANYGPNLTIISIGANHIGETGYYPLVFRDDGLPGLVPREYILGPDNGGWSRYFTGNSDFPGSLGVSVPPPESFDWQVGVYFYDVPTYPGSTNHPYGYILISDISIVSGPVPVAGTNKGIVNTVNCCCK